MNNTSEHLPTEGGRPIDWQRDDPELTTDPGDLSENPRLDQPAGPEENEQLAKVIPIGRHADELHGPPEPEVMSISSNPIHDEMAHDTVDRRHEQHWYDRKKKAELKDHQERTDSKIKRHAWKAIGVVLLAVTGPIIAHNAPHNLGLDRPDPTETTSLHPNQLRADLGSLEDLQPGNDVLILAGDTSIQKGSEMVRVRDVVLTGIDTEGVPHSILWLDGGRPQSAPVDDVEAIVDRDGKDWELGKASTIAHIQAEQTQATNPIVERARIDKVDKRDGNVFVSFKNVSAAGAPVGESEPLAQQIG